MLSLTSSGIPTTVLAPSLMLMIATSRLVFAKKKKMNTKHPKTLKLHKAIHCLSFAIFISLNITAAASCWQLQRICYDSRVLQNSQFRKCSCRRNNPHKTMLENIYKGGSICVDKTAKACRITLSKFVMDMFVIILRFVYWCRAQQNYESSA